MSRHSRLRIVVTGVLVAETPLHVGGFGESVETDMPLARDGRGNLYVPGTSLAGPLRSWCRERFAADDFREIWGFSEQDKGHAAHVIIEDATIKDSASILIEIRDGVGIDRNTGTAADQIKYDRAVLPRGTKLSFGMEVDVPVDLSTERTKAMFGHLLEALEAGRIKIGAARTRGLGRVKLVEGEVKIQTLDTPEGIIAMLRRGGTSETISSLLSHGDEVYLKACPRLDIEIAWKPTLPVMVKAGMEGIAVDTVPLVSGSGNSVAPVLPGASIKGVLRNQAERIIRTVLGRDAPNDSNSTQRFLAQIQLPLIDALFGTAGSEQRPDLGLGVLDVDDCYATQTTTREAWDAIVEARNDAELLEKLQVAHLGNWSKADQVAIDRWTGGAADGLLFSLLEPRRQKWEPIRLSLDLARLNKAERLPALALVFFLFRDLTDSLITFGFGRNRGMGAVAIDSIKLTGFDLDELDPALGALNSLDLDLGRLGEKEAEIRRTLSSAWSGWVDKEVSRTKSGV